ncbi:iron ABC transporter permease [Bacillus sp. S70]|uniref:FecCD family ABC transporter permease n=1 Tax=unclassified Bacillus (in: firmicutes) TaxID=185979 RepID=UPI00190D59D6|nr:MULTISPECIES: iron ABC transporter permease [unclassified Bacillus (in: firmicutes)]HEQ3529395.1 iron ABC transporter permease [Bacillus cereus]MBJ9983043.1 iron ABC transporter permease [Bacillus sp. S29]MBK0102838.1 iron ABC transporter permease [Bacillus sp. S70]MBK0108151.1 iron ABC transporter permease [Bacillus sp. S73]MBK0137394.1 iron ABC transporter permease [Bacillus sp. S72]
MNRKDVKRMTKDHDSPRSIAFTYKLILSLIAFFLIFMVAMVLGAADTSIKDVWLALTSSAKGDKISIIREIRLPREVAAIFVGAGLAVSGAIMQGLTRNPLADPGLLGLSGGANAALALTLAFNPSISYLYLTLACFIGAAIGAIMVFGIGMVKKGGLSPLRIVLAGAAVSAFLLAISEGIGIYFKISQDVSLWTAGGVIGTTWSQLKIIIPVISISIFIAILLAKKLTVLSFSEEVAIGLGQKIIVIKTILFIIIILLAGASVALVGNMAFIGLMVPHMVRPIVGPDYRFVIPMSAIAGASFMLLADTIGRTINAPYETPVAAIVAIVGLPFFLFIVRKGGKTFS